MDKQQRLIVAILGGILAVLVICLVVLVLTRTPEIIVSDFDKPPFDENALLGTPEEAVAREDYRTINVKDNYSFSICGAPSFADGSLVPYFASHGTNEVWLLLKVYDVDGTELGKSGLIRPGEYVKSIALSRAPSGDTVQVKILSYEPETYFSRGAASAVLPLSTD